ncbi:aspartate-rich protein 1-like isoform X3 [Pongo pygmaeus]|uniref:aspartate-rich protein 1-like isoform X3 n=3 Tax=Pongo pygmaeus TaxID=9600 RepID=UPI00300D2587
MWNILTCCVCHKVSSNCGWHRGKAASSYESDIYEAVAAATSESSTVEPGKLDVGATEGQDLQHISNQKMPTGSVPDLEDSALDIVEDMLPERVSYTAQNSYPPVPDLEECALDILENKKLSHMVNYTAHNSYRPPENCLSLKFLPPSEEDDDDAQILPSPVQDSPEDNLSSVSLPRNEDYDGDDDDDDDDDDDAQILPSPVQASVEDKLSLICLPPSEDDDWDDDHHDAQILPSPIQAWPEDHLFLRRPPRCKHEKDDDGDLDAHITAQKENDLTLESLSEEEIPPAWPEDRLFLRRPPRCKHEKDDDGDLDAHITAQKENDLTLESLSEEEIPPGRQLRARKNPMGKGSQEPPGYPCCL